MSHRAVSGNAFAHLGLRHSSPLAARVTEQAVEAGMRKMDDPQAEFEIDIMILDYLAHRTVAKAIEIRVAEIQGMVSEDYELEQEEGGTAMLFDTWHRLTSIKHSGKSISTDLEAKLQLVTVALTFLYRNRRSVWNKTPTQLRRLREQHAQRARDVLAAHPELRVTPLVNGDHQHQPATSEVRGAAEETSASTTMTASELELDARHARSLRSLRIPETRQIMDRDRIMPLLDVLPEFMQLCVLAESLLNLNATAWEVAAQFMLQAVLEQYLIFGRPPNDTQDEAFAWNLPAVNWPEIRAKYLDFFRPTSRGTGRGQGQRPALSPAEALPLFPAVEFEAAVIKFLKDLLGALKTPVLRKVEMGRWPELESILEGT